MFNRMRCQQNDFRCAACPQTLELLPKFSTFKEVCDHSLQVHRVSLETAVQSSTLLPDKLAIYLCKLCTTDHMEIFFCETLVKKHLETHSAFFLKRWKDYTEIKCRICEDVIEEADLEEHVVKLHPLHMFADINDLENYKVKCSPKSPPIKDLNFSLDIKAIPVLNKMRSWQSSQPASEDSSLWDSCFQPEQLIYKYFSKLAPAAPGQEEKPTIVETVTQPLIRVKPLSVLQAQAKPALKCEHQKSPKSEARQSPSKKHSRRSPSSSKIQRSPSSRPCKTSTRSLSQHNSRSRSPLPTTTKERALPPVKTWWLKRNHSQYVPTGTCLLCGLQVPKNRLAMHNIYNHQDMMFRCKVGSCRTSRRSCYLYANQLNNHHQDYHNLNKFNNLNTSKSLTGLPASMVKISCSKCPHFVLFPDTNPVVKHLWSVHRIEDHPVSLLRYHCRVCEAPFSSVDRVVEHSRDHLADRSQSRTDSELDQGSTGYSSGRRSSGRNIFTSPSRMRMRSSSRRIRSPSRKSRRSPSRKSRRSPSRKSRRSSGTKSRRSPSTKIRRSPSMKSRRSPSTKSRRSQSTKSRRSPSRKSRRSPSRKSKISPSRKSRRSPSWNSRSSSSRISRRSPSRKRKGSSNRTSRSRSGSPPCNTSQFYKYRGRGWSGNEG